MSAAIDILLKGDLHEVFGERDPIPRRAAIDVLFAPDILFSDPLGAGVDDEGDVDEPRPNRDVVEV